MRKRLVFQQPKVRKLNQILMKTALTLLETK